MAQQQLLAGEQGLALNKGLWLPGTRGGIIVGLGGLEGGIGAGKGSWGHPTSQIFILPWQTLTKQGRAGTIKPSWQQECGK